MLVMHKEPGKESAMTSAAKYKKWLINILVFIIVTILMLAAAEVAMRWLDGYRMSTIELQQNLNSTQQED